MSNVSIWKSVEIEAASCLPLRKSNEWRLPIKPISMDQREVDSGLFCFAMTGALSPPLSAQKSVCHSTFSWWVRCDLSFSLSFTLSLFLSLSLWTPSITRPSERVAWQWCDGAAKTVKMDCYPGRFANAHTHAQWMCDTQTNRRGHTSVHSPIFIHTIAQMHNHTIADCAAACTHAHGSVNSSACQPKVAQSDKVFQLETGPGRHHGSTASTTTWNTHTWNVFFKYTNSDTIFFFNIVASISVIPILSALGVVKLSQANMSSSSR